MNILSIVAVLIISWPSFGLAQKTESLQTSIVTIPDGNGGIGFDDLTFAYGLGKVIVPGGRTGKLNLIDPSTKEIISIEGFSSEKEYQGGHGEGTTSADEGNGLIFATDRTKKTLNIVDPVAKKIIASATLSADPDYVRFVQTTNEVWVTEPSAEQVEVFTFNITGKSTLEHSLSISVPGGPESLVVDNVRQPRQRRGQRAYTHLWSGTTVAIDVKSHSIVARWPNGCNGSRGIALDDKRGFLFAGCAEGKAIVLDLNHEGKQLSSLQSGSGVDVISFNPTLSHLYLPAAKSASMAIIAVSKEGKLSLLNAVSTAKGSHCVTADNHNNVWVCDPSHGQLLLFTDKNL